MRKVLLGISFLLIVAQFILVLSIPIASIGDHFDSSSLIIPLFGFVFYGLGLLLNTSLKHRAENDDAASFYFKYALIFFIFIVMPVGGAIWLILSFLRGIS